MKSQKQKPIKMYEIINWLVGVNDEMPENFINQKNKLKTLVPYITEQLWNKPKIIIYLNKHLNDLYNIPDSIEALVLLKKIFKYQKITQLDLFQLMPKFQPNVISEIQKIENYDTGNAKGKATMLFNKFGLDQTYTLFKQKKITKEAIKNATTPEEKELIKSILIKEEEKIKANIPKADKNIFFNSITQELIDKEELILFDVSLLKKRNQVLFIFIDKNNHKKYHLKPFMAKIYISKQDGVINNDYIEEITEDKFNGYKLLNIQAYTRLKYMLNDSYKRILNGH